MSRIEQWLDKTFGYQLIRSGCEGDPLDQRPVYMKRWFIIMNDPHNNRRDSSMKEFAFVAGCKTRINKSGPQLYLHKIMLSDNDRECHDHPWDFHSLILWNGYDEETPDGKRKRKWPGMFLVRPATWRHRVHVAADAPAWTLVVTANVKRNWGFWRGEFFIPWRMFLRKKCEPKVDQVDQ